MPAHAPQKHRKNKDTPQTHATHSTRGPERLVASQPSARLLAMIQNSPNVTATARLQRLAQASRLTAAPEPLQGKAALKSTPSAQSRPVLQRSIASRWNWAAYFNGLPHNQQCINAINTGEARTTMHVVHDAATGDIQQRIIHLHAWRNGAWTDVGTVTIDSSPTPIAGPVGPAGGGLGRLGYDNRVLTMHTAAAGGAGNAGVATRIFPAVMRWVDQNLRGVQEISMNPAGGAASKSVVSMLAGHLGNPHDHALAGAARTARRTAATAAAAAAAAGGPAVVEIGAGAGPAGQLNTWDTRLNPEHQHDLAALEHAPAGLHVGDNTMAFAGPAPGPGPARAAEVATLRSERDFFQNTLAGPAHPVINAAHPAHPLFQHAGALTNDAIDADPRQAARILRMARLSARSGAAGTGGVVDTGYQINLSGAALAAIMPGATQP